MSAASRPYLGGQLHRLLWIPLLVPREAIFQTANWEPQLSQQIVLIATVLMARVIAIVIAIALAIVIAMMVRPQDALRVCES